MDGADSAAASLRYAPCALRPGRFSFLGPAAGPSNERRHVPNQEKTAAVAEITGRFRSSSAAVLTEYRGLTMAQLTQLRRSLGSETTYAVVKNTLTKLAASEAGYPIPEELLTGPTAIAFVSGDPVEAAKGLRDFARTNPSLVIKGGVVEGKALSADEVRRLADLESREVLLARLAGVLQASLSKAAGLFQAPLSQVARLVAALQEKKQSADAAPAVAESESQSESQSESPAGSQPAAG
jgi:large subunit ribosomal protein L10